MVEQIQYILKYHKRLGLVIQPQQFEFKAGPESVVPVGQDFARNLMRADGVMPDFFEIHLPSGEVIELLMDPLVKN